MTAVGTREKLLGQTSVDESRVRQVNSLVKGQNPDQLDQELGRRMPQFGRPRGEDVRMMAKKMDDLIGTGDENVQRQSTVQRVGKRPL